MCAVRRSLRAAVVLFVASLCALPALAQSARFLSVEARSHIPTLYASANPCASASTHSSNAVSGESSETNVSPLPCDRPEPATRTTVDPCAQSLGAARASAGCASARDYVRDHLNTMGKQGQSILRARDKVLVILETDNACSDWYRAKDPNPAATFRTVSFALDRDSDTYARLVPESGGIQFIRNPYVASVLQGDGPGATVTINLNGAFFFPVANLVVDRFEGGPLRFRGVRATPVGPYSGGSFHAQVLALLHEFGHVIDLLPMDRDDYEGKSRQNTADVLRACRAQVESKEAPRTFLASR